MKIKKVGVTTKTKVSPQLNEVCDLVIILSPGEQTAESFHTLVKQNITYELYMDEVSDMELRLSELFKGLAYLVDNNKIIHYLDKDNLNNLSDHTYFHLLFELAQTERNLVKPNINLNFVLGAV